MPSQRHPDDGPQSEKHTIDLFFGALLRLGVWTGDWETWYGTRPLAPWARQPRLAPRHSEEAPRQRTAR